MSPCTAHNSDVDWVAEALNSKVKGLRAILCEEQKKQLLSSLSAYEKRIAEYTKGLGDLYIDKVRGLLNEEDFAALSRDFSLEKSRLECARRESRRQLAEIEDRIALGDNRKALMEQYVNLDHLTREIVEILIDHITVGKRIPGT